MQEAVASACERPYPEAYVFFEAFGKAIMIIPVNLWTKRTVGGRQPPARLNAEQVSVLLNCQPHDVPVLVAARWFKPLGNPLANSLNFMPRWNC